MKSSFYPPADRGKQWWEKSFPRGYFTAIEKIMFHTTETTSWPSYGNGAIAPTLTYKVATREWRQHNFLDTSARALGDPASTPVKENRDNVIQIEIIWYAKDVGNLPDSAYRDLAAFVAYVRSEWGGPSLNYAKVGGPNDNVHLTSAQYDAFNGLIGHANAPSPSTHWDPGKLDYAKIVAYVKELEAKPTPSKPSPPPTPSTPSTTGDISMADAASLEALIKAFDKKEADRYKVYSGRYSDLSVRLSRIEAALAQITTDASQTKPTDTPPAV